MPDPMTAAESVRAYVETWSPYNGGRSLAQHGGQHLFLRDLRQVLDDLDATKAELLQFAQAVSDISDVLAREPIGGAR